MSEPVGHVTVPYPLVEDGVHSVTHLAKAAAKVEILSASEAAAHAWVVVGVGLSQVMPLPKECPAELQAAFAALPVDKIDWKELLKTILPLILKLLACVVLMVGLVGFAEAVPPQAPAMKCLCPSGGKCSCKGKCDCGANCKCKACPGKKAKPKAKKTVYQFRQPAKMIGGSC